MRKGVISVVVPIFNVEKYLDRCIHSIVNQSYQNLEIILVDDGSPDRCPEMCDQWARKDSRIKVVHKENGGLGLARNTGIENATGEYICFFDSDDYIALDTLEKTYRLANDEQADIVVFGHCQVRSNAETGRTCIPCSPKLVYAGKEIQSTFLPDLIGPDTSTGAFTNLWMSAWGALFSMELISRTNWRFVSERDIISEDVYSLLILYKDVKKVAVIPEALYFYCENAASLTHTYKADRFERIKHFYDACIDVCDELKYGEKVKQRLAYPFISNTIAAMKMIIAADINEGQKRTAFREICADKKLHEVINAANIRKEKLTRKVLILTLKYRLYGMCRILIAIKAQKGLGKRKT